MSRAWLLLLVLAGVYPAHALAIDAEKAAQAAAAFDSLYGADLKRVRATRDAKDDLDLAARLLQAARAAAGQPEFLAILCEKAADLALGHPDGYATAAEAVQLQAATIPGMAAPCADRMVDVRQRQFDSAPAGARAAAGEALIDAILAALAERQKTGAVPGEAAYCRRALTVARAIKSDRAAALDARLKDLEQAARLAIEIENLKKQVAAQPQTQAVRQRLVRLLLVDGNDAPEAAKFLEGIQDAALLKYVPAAARPLEDAPELACLELGDWYRGLAETAPPGAKPLMLARAREYYQRFLSLHATEDINRAKAAAALQKAEEEIQKSAAPPPAPAPAARLAPPPKPGGSGQGIDLLALIDPVLDLVKGTCARQDDGLAINAGQVMVPVVVRGSYDLDVRFVRVSGSNTVGVVLPVDSGQALLALSHLGAKAHGIEMISGKGACENETSVKPGTLENGREYRLRVRVRTSGSLTQIAAELDGKPLLQWSGPQSALSLHFGWKMPNAQCPGLGAAYSNVVFKSAQLAMLPGSQARPLPRSATPAIPK